MKRTFWVILFELFVLRLLWAPVGILRGIVGWKTNTEAPDVAQFRIVWSVLSLFMSAFPLFFIWAQYKFPEAGHTVSVYWPICGSIIIYCFNGWCYKSFTMMRNDDPFRLYQ